MWLCCDWITFRMNLIKFEFANLTPVERNRGAYHMLYLQDSTHKDFPNSFFFLAVKKPTNSTIAFSIVDERFWVFPHPVTNQYQGH
jgi:hypothetical protein